MPLTYSIAYGLIAGIGLYIILSLTFWFFEKAFGWPQPVFYPPSEDDAMEDMIAKDEQAKVDDKGKGQQDSH